MSAKRASPRKEGGDGDLVGGVERQGRRAVRRERRVSEVEARKAPAVGGLERQRGERARVERGDTGVDAIG